MTDTDKPRAPKAKAASSAGMIQKCSSVPASKVNADKAKESPLSEKAKGKTAASKAKAPAACAKKAAGKKRKKTGKQKKAFHFHLRPAWFAFLLFAAVACGALKVTYDFIRIPPGETQEKEETAAVEAAADEGGLYSIGQPAGNLLQHYSNHIDFGLAASNDKYLFKYQENNGRSCLLRMDLNTGSAKVVLSGYLVKGLNIVNDKLYMIMEQKDGDDYYQMLAWSDIENISVTPIKTTKADFIVSYLSDGENLYYTINNDYYIYKADSSSAIEKLYQADTGGVTPHLLGIREGRLYYVNGQGLWSLGLNSKEHRLISSQYSSAEQYPILTDEGILAFYNLAHTRIDKIGYDGKYIETMADEAQIAEAGGVDSINYSSGYLFMEAKGNLYYTNGKQGRLSRLEEVSGVTEAFYLTDDAIITETQENGNPTATKIVYLLAS